MTFRFAATTIIVAALLAATMLCATCAAGATEPAVVFSSPREGAVIADGAVVITGRTNPPRKVTLLLNGKPVSGVGTDGVSFWAAVAPAAGKNRLEVKDGTVLGVLNFSYGAPARGAAAYRFHRPLQDGDCDACHPSPTRKKPTTATAETCFTCHTRWKHPFTHGPVAAGECIFCHDPHGSAFPGMTHDVPRTSCRNCHDQSSSRAHMERSGNQDCTKCHDPHGGKDQLLLK